MRQIIQISVSTFERTNLIVALCDDHSIWQYEQHSRGWFKLPDIPKPLTSKEVSLMNSLEKKENKGMLSEDELEKLIELRKRNEQEDTM